MDNITKPALLRLIKEQSEGNTQISSLLYEEFRYFLKDYVEKLVRQTVVIMDYMQTKTMAVSHLYHILKHIPASNDILKQCTGKMISDMKPCFHIPKASFKKFVQMIVDEYKDDMRYSKDALNLLQMVSEDHLKKYAKMTIKNARHAGRVEIQPRDLQLAKRADPESLYADRADIPKSPHIKNVVDYDIQSLFEEISKSLRRDKSINDNAVQQINTVLNRLAHVIMSKSNDLVILKRSAKIESVTLQSAVRLIMNGELHKHAVSSGIKAVTKYLSSQNTGLSFSLKETRKVMDNYTNRRIAKEAVVYLTAVLEYIASELCEISGQSTEQLITGTIVKKMVGEDEEMSLLLYTLDINFV
jgi:histone H3/H4